MTTTSMTLVRAYLVHWNAPDWCAESVAALLASRGVEIDVTIVNNGGELDLPPEVRILRPGRNLGFAAAANVALRDSAGAPYVLVGSHDVRVQPSTVRMLVDFLALDPELGIVGPVLNGEGDTQDLDWINGSLLLMRREVAESLRFDERYGSYVEDVDFCYRARDRGWHVARVGGAHATTVGSVDRRKALVLMHANTLVFFARRKQLRLLAKRVIYLLSHAFREARAGSADQASAYAWALLLGIWRFLRFPFQQSESPTAGRNGR